MECLDIQVCMGTGGLPLHHDIRRIDPGQYFLDGFTGKWQLLIWLYGKGGEVQRRDIGLCYEWHTPAPGGAEGVKGVVPGYQWQYLTPWMGDHKEVHVIEYGTLLDPPLPLEGPTTIVATSFGVSNEVPDNEEISRGMRSLCSKILENCQIRRRIHSNNF